MSKTIQQQILAKVTLLTEQSLPKNSGILYHLKNLSISTALKQYFGVFNVIYVVFYSQGECGAVSLLDRKFNKLFTMLYEQTGEGLASWIPTPDKTLQ